MRRVDPLVPPSALLPQCDTRSGGVVPLVHEPGGIRPYSATLAVPPLEMGKHDTTATKWTENKETEYSDDGETKPDSVPIPHYDS
jgi:hypothetical protein